MMLTCFLDLSSYEQVLFGKCIIMCKGIVMLNCLNSIVLANLGSFVDGVKNMYCFWCR